MNLKSTAESMFILLSDRATWLCTGDGSSLGNLLVAFSIESWGKVRACYRGREPEDSEIERRISFAHQPQEYLALPVTLESCGEVEECTFGAEGMSIRRGRFKMQLLKLFIPSKGCDGKWIWLIPMTSLSPLSPEQCFGHHHDICSGSSNSFWDSLSQATDVEVRILESFPQSSYSSFGRNFKPLP